MHVLHTSLFLRTIIESRVSVCAERLNSSFAAQPVVTCRTHAACDGQSNCSIIFLNNLAAVSGYDYSWNTFMVLSVVAIATSKFVPSEQPQDTTHLTDSSRRA